MSELTSADIVDMIAYALNEAKPNVRLKRIQDDVWIIINGQVFIVKVEKVNGRKI